jgi:hypothetical protein
MTFAYRQTLIFSPALVTVLVRLCPCGDSFFTATVGKTSTLRIFPHRAWTGGRHARTGAGD